SLWRLKLRTGRFPPGALELVEVVAAGTNAALLLDEMRRGEPRVGRQRKRLQLADQFGVRALGFDPVALETFEDQLDAVDALEDKAHALDGDGSAVAILPHQRLGGVREFGEPRQAEKPAGAFDRMHQPE